MASRMRRRPAPPREAGDAYLTIVADQPQDGTGGELRVKIDSPSLAGTRAGIEFYDGDWGTNLFDDHAARQMLHGTSKKLCNPPPTSL